MSKTMAEVLAEHSIDTYQNQMHDETRWFCTNEGCAFETDNWHGVADREIAKHHEEVLSAAGFGLVADAKAEALKEAADKTMGPSDVLLDGATCRWIAMELRESAQALRDAS